MKKSRIATYIIILAIIIFLYFQFSEKPVSNVSEELAKCIGENSKLYTASWCSHCKDQKKMFGDNVKFLDIFECDSDDWVKCKELNILSVPTWEIKTQRYVGVQSVEKLKELTGCNYLQ